MDIETKARDAALQCAIKLKTYSAERVKLKLPATQGEVSNIFADEIAKALRSVRAETLRTAITKVREAMDYAGIRWEEWGERALTTAEKLDEAVAELERMAKEAEQ